jgi:hypothetical protein
MIHYSQSIIMGQIAAMREPASQLGSRIVPILEEDEAAVSGDTEHELKEDHQSRPLSPELIRWCQHLGMAPGAAASWAAVHEKPYVAMMCYFTSDLVSSCTLIATFVVPITRLRYSIPGGIAVCLQLLNTVLFWHRGLAHGKSTFWKVTFIFWALGVVSACTIGFTRQDEDSVPYKNRLLFTAISATGITLTNFAMKSGGAASSVPTEPYKSMLRPFLGALRDMIKILDSLTDVAVITILVAQV